MQNNDFFPNENYKLPNTSNYMKFQDGENNFRVLSSAIIGWEYWNTEDKPIRSRENFDEIPHDIKTDKNGNQKISHFWAFVVWNYEANKVQILELTQKSIMQPIQALIKNPKWGNPKGYDITITRSGSGFDTEYTVMPNPHSDLSPEITSAQLRTKVNLNALYEGADPFKS